MSEIVNDSLKKIVKGTTIVFAGTIISLLLAFVGRIILVRTTTQIEYGVYSIAFTIFSIFVLIATLGLSEGSTRYIALFRGKGEEDNVRGVISSSIKIALVSSFSLAAISFFASDFISLNIYHNPELSNPLKIFSIAIPFSVLVSVLIAIFRGFGKVDTKVYFQDMLQPVLFLLCLISVVLYNISFIGVVYAYILSIVVTCAVLVLYTLKRYSFVAGMNRVCNPMTRKLLSFSIPLLGVSMLMMVMAWTDQLMLGYFKTPDVVGVYNVAFPLANLLSIIPGSLSFLYIPIIMQLHSKHLIDDIKRNYIILTKWTLLLSSPIFFILFLFPDVVLNLMFGSRYVGANSTLQILALGFFLNFSLGFTYNLLIVIGETKFPMFAYIISAITNIFLNIILIPSMGIIGAAIASVVSIIVVKTLNTVQLYKCFKVHPFTKNYLKIVGLLILYLYIFDILKNIVTMSFWLFMTLFLLFLVFYGISLLFTKSLDKEDIMILLMIENQLDMDLSSIKGFLKRFV